MLCTNTTQYFLQKYSQLALIDEPSDPRYKSFNLGSVESEVGEFLYGMTKLIKPNRVLETGTYKGVSAAYIGQALKENGFGCLDTLEYDSQHQADIRALWSAAEVDARINLFLESSLTFIPLSFYELMFLDTEPSIRFQELVRFYPCLQPGGFVFLHDLPRGFCKGNVNPDHPEFVDWPWGSVPEELKILLKEGKLIKWHFPNPREMAGFYKPRDDDYGV